MKRQAPGHSRLCLPPAYTPLGDISEVDHNPTDASQEATTADERTADLLAQLQSSAEQVPEQGRGSLESICRAVAERAKAEQLGFPEAVSAFRQLCEQQITQQFRSNLAAAQAMSTVLDLGNTIAASLSGPAPASSAPQSYLHRQLEAAAQFWRASDPATDLLGLPKAPQAAAKAAGSKRLPGAQLAAAGKRPKLQGKKAQKGASELSPSVQLVLAQLLDLLTADQQTSNVASMSNQHSAGTARESSPIPEVGKVLRAPKAAARKVLTSHAARTCQAVAFDWSELAGLLRRGEVPSLEDVAEHVQATCRAAADQAFSEDSTTRKGRLVAAAEQYGVAVIEGMQGLVGPPEKPKEAAKEATAHHAAPAQDLPVSIQANREPYFQGDWRQKPYTARPYKRLAAYELAENRAVMSWKMRTSKKGGCDGQHCSSQASLGTYRLEADAFQTQCACLATNMECGAACGCKQASCANRAISRRSSLKLGSDVVESDVWGLDCYTRRNILDAALESQAFGRYKPGPRPTSRLGAGDAVAAGENPRHSTRGAEVLLAEAEATELAELGLPGDRPAAALSAHSTSSEQRPDSKPPDRGPSPEDAANDWIDQHVLPAINAQGDDGWDLPRALQQVKAHSKEAGNGASVKAAAAVLQRFAKVGSNYFRVHPKGVGILCQRPEGLPQLTFVEEYFGEVHTPWRWFEMQDAIKKTSGSELPDFYNIVLERPRDDPAGYDVLFVDAASKGAFASRMSHSCTPNCQAVVMAANGKLTIALYTLRQVLHGEELTFDYACVTESEREFKAATCLCATRGCRGSFLGFSGSRAFMQVMTTHHGFLDRQAVLLRAREPMTPADRDLLEEFGMRTSALGRPHDKVPPWLLKWAALVLGFVQQERRLLPAQLLALRLPLVHYTPLTAAAEAKGVSDNRLQNVVITLDKVRLCLQQAGQSQEAPLRLLSDQEATDHLWTGDKSIARRVLWALAGPLASQQAARDLQEATCLEAAREALSKSREGLSQLGKLCAYVYEPAAHAQEAREKLMRLSELVRATDEVAGGGYTALADMAFLYASTHQWFLFSGGYQGFASQPVALNRSDLGLDRAAVPARANGVDEDGGEALQAAKPGGGLSKRYGAAFIWGQLVFWHKQTIYDPTATLSAERRGTLSLPDIESCCAGAKGRYSAKDRESLLQHLEKRPDAPWKGNGMWSFKNANRVYGSPMFDAAWRRAGCPNADSDLPGIVAQLHACATPWKRT